MLEAARRRPILKSESPMRSPRSRRHNVNTTTAHNHRGFLGELKEHRTAAGRGDACCALQATQTGTLPRMVE